MNPQKTTKATDDLDWVDNWDSAMCAINSIINQWHLRRQHDWEPVMVSMPVGLWGAMCNAAPKLCDRVCKTILGLPVNIDNDCSEWRLE